MNALFQFVDAGITRLGRLHLLIPESATKLQTQLSTLPSTRRIDLQNNQSVEEIDWLEAEGDYTKIHTRSKTFISNKGIGEIESKLNPHQFQRVHRSAIVAIQAIQEIHREPSGPQIVLRDGHTLKVSRSYVEAVRKLIL